MPTVTAIIPVYNGAAYLGEALASVLAQTCPIDEVLVVDDGSTDASAEVARAANPTVRVITQPRAGAGAARNLGVAHATGDLLAFLDADDLWMPDKTALQLDALAADPALEVVFGQVINFTDAEGPRDLPGHVPGIIAGTMLLPREAFRRIGDFPTDGGVGEFLDWYARALDGGARMMTLPEVVMRRRLHDRNMTRALPGAQGRAAYLRVVSAALRRRKTSSP